MDDPLREVRLLVHRRDEGVGDDVVDEVGAHAAGIAQEVDLHGRRAVGQDLGPGVLGVALQVDEDVDPVIVDAPCRVRVRELAHVDEAIEGCQQPLAHVAAVVGAEAVAEDLEARAVVPLQQLGDQASRGMALEVGRQVAQPDAAALRRGIDLARGRTSRGATASRAPTGACARGGRPGRRSSPGSGMATRARRPGAGLRGSPHSPFRGRANRTRGAAHCRAGTGRAPDRARTPAPGEKPGSPPRAAPGP